MKARLLLGGTAGLTGAAGLLLAVSAGAPVWLPAGPAVADAIVIGTGGLEPVERRTVVDRPVTFLNRAAAPAHVEFAGDAGHHIFDVSGELSAVFHRPGRHTYVVHLGDGRTLHGVVSVAGDRETAVGPRTCRGLTVRETCLER